MSKKSGLKLSTRLALAFAAMLALTLAVGGIALQRLQVIHTATDEMAINWLPSIRTLGDARSAANRIRRAESDHLLSTSESDMVAIEGQIIEQKAAMTEAISSFEPVADSAEEKALLVQFRKHEDAWLGQQQKLFALSRNAKTKGEALAMLRGDSRKSFNDMVQVLNDLVQYEDKGSRTSSASANAAYQSAIIWVMGIGAFALVVAAALGIWIVRGVTRQLGGEPAEAADLAKRVADGDLSVQIQVKNGDQSSLVAALKRMQDSLSAIVNGVRQNADSVATASGQISQGNNDLSSRTEEQASALQQTAASMKQLATTVHQNAANAEQGNELAVAACDVATRGGEVVGQVVETMKGINDSSRKIADIIGVIDGIAFQTNILALNAAVEAARAGEQGRGFAVVASEVRSLAQRSADAAKEIKQLITASVERVEQGSALVDQAGTTMEEVVQSIRRVTDLMGEISAASREQSAGVAQIGEAVAQMDQATQQNAALVEESAAAADSLKAQAGQLVGAVSVFKLAGQASVASNMPNVTGAPPAPANVPRPAYATTKASAPVSRPVVSPNLSTPAKTGTDDDWTTF
ncbi:methyl-accepting chemotaxis protein [Ramlibacter humi]|uniref:Methyl-accepting chemotaxis protein n=1 Tax=Ramlibacter humi TaxID=2530451 RepID=A0A4Z0CDI3_9BURK|nr:methyl-accepting chemotaxis protein [Ramlibacter humi]TFZ08365.1 methyl-accepting chemotaxis protein [Ramlibacter humi]